jgi:hypothetical protein
VVPHLFFIILSLIHDDLYQAERKRMVLIEDRLDHEKWVEKD